jgi:DNA-binding LacI/PurR family transcriptional regulator
MLGSNRSTRGYRALFRIDNNYAEMGRLAAPQLVRRIETPSAARSVTLLDPSLRIRRTSAAPG